MEKHYIDNPLYSIKLVYVIMVTCWGKGFNMKMKDTVNIAET